MGIDQMDKIAADRFNGAESYANTSVGIFTPTTQNAGNNEVTKSLKTVINEATLKRMNNKTEVSNGVAKENNIMLLSNATKKEFNITVDDIAHYASRSAPHRRQYVEHNKE